MSGTSSKLTKSKSDGELSRKGAGCNFHGVFTLRSYKKHRSSILEGMGSKGRLLTLADINGQPFKVGNLPSTGGNISGIELLPPGGTVQTMSTRIAADKPPSASSKHDDCVAYKGSSCKDHLVTMHQSECAPLSPSTFLRVLHYERQIAFDSYDDSGYDTSSSLPSLPRMAIVENDGEGETSVTGEVNVDTVDCRNNTVHQFISFLSSCSDDKAAEEDETDAATTRITGCSGHVHHLTKNQDPAYDIILF
jgi:hypothetical protein